MNSVRFVVDPTPRGPKHHLADVAIVLPELGVKIVGAAVWRARKGGTGIYVTLPADKAVKEGGEEKFFNMIRDVEPKSGATGRLKTAIVQAYKDQCPGAAMEIETSGDAHAEADA